MRAPSSLTKAFIAVAALAALWLGAPRLAQLVSRPAVQTAITGEQARDASPSIATASSPSPSPAAPSATSSPSPAADTKRERPVIDPATLPAGTVWTFNDGEVERTYRIAMDALYVPSGPTETRMRTIPAQASLDALLAAAKDLGRQSGVQPRLVLYALDGTRPLIVSTQVHIMADDQAAVNAAAASLGLTGWRTPSYAPGHAIADVVGDPAQPLRAAAALAGLPGVKSAAPLLAVQHAALAAPVNDPLFPDEWHLLNTGQQGGLAGIDINVVPVWATAKGSGINIGIVDDSLQITHPDISPNAAPSGHYDWNGNDDDPSPFASADSHGTAVGGLAAARADNGIGVSGVAPLATLYGLRLISAPTTDAEDAEAMNWKNDVIQIKNNSWGPANDSDDLNPAGSLWKASVATGTSSGRDGLGTIFLFASGNGRDQDHQGPKNGYASNVNVIAVGAIGNSGLPAYFSEGGPHLVVSAPGAAGIVTTDRAGSSGYNDGIGVDDLADSNYTKTFNGTSAACPIAAGVVALMLETNPDLGWRDVKEILLRSSTQLQPSDTDWVTRDGGQPDLPLIKHHSFYGGGLVNAQAATSLASSWTPLGEEKFSIVTSPVGTKTIPDVGAAVLIPLDLSNSTALRVEHVELTLNITHRFRGDLEIKLISPSGTVSTFATISYGDSGDNYTSWTFTSVRHWGEASNGVWTLSVQDVYAGITGQFVSATLKTRGTIANPPTITLQPEGATVAQGSSVSLTTAGQEENLSYQWRLNGTPVKGATSATLNLPAITLAQAGSYTCRVSNAQGGSAITTPAPVIVYNPDPQTRTVNLGTQFSTGMIAAGPIDSFQWRFNDSPLSDSSRISGSSAGTLSVTPLALDDAGVYTLQAMVDGEPLPTGAITLAVRTPPEVTVPATFTARIGGGVALPLVTDGGPYFYRYFGLPAGLTYNTSTGVISGRTTAIGSTVVVLTVNNAFGQTTTRTFILTVEPVPVILTGTFNGYVARDPSLAQNLGGKITFTTTGKGQLTGSLVLGGSSYALKGLLGGASGADATASISIPRAGLPPLDLQLTLPIDGSAVTGTLNSSAAVTAWRSPWSKSAPATRFAGPYTFALEAPDGDGWPAGYSTGTLSIATTGAASWTLQPADGSAALKGSSAVAADGSIPLYAPTASPAGSFVGFLTVPDNTTPSAPITGTLSWLRGSTTSASLASPVGFGPVSLTPYGGRYAAPASGTLLLGLPKVAGNATLFFDGDAADLGAQEAALTPFVFTLASGNKVVLPSPNPTALKLTLTTSTGLFSGTFTVTDPNPLNASATVKRSGKFSGVVLRNEGAGAGFFILPALPGSGAGTRSGSVIFSGAE